MLRRLARTGPSWLGAPHITNSYVPYVDSLVVVFEKMKSLTFYKITSLSTLVDSCLHAATTMMYY